MWMPLEKLKKVKTEFLFMTHENVFSIAIWHLILFVLFVFSQGSYLVAT